MATRSRTVVFLQYRQSFSRTTKKPIQQPVLYDASETAGLLGGAAKINTLGDATAIVEMSTLPPRWIDIVEEIEDEMQQIKNQISSLEQLHKKHLLPGFEDNFNDEQVIEQTSDQITRRIQESQKKIKQIDRLTKTTGEVSPQQIALSKNIQISLAQKLHDVSSQYRKEQNMYLQKLRGREAKGNQIFVREGFSEDDDYRLETGFTDNQLAQVASNERAISEREKAINEIFKSMHAVATIFQDLNTMVIDQGTILDRIDYNIDMVATHMEDAVKELNKGAEYQKGSRMKLCIIILGLFIVLAIIILLFKRRR